MSFAGARGRRLVAVMPHPDDEAYSAAGTLALAASGGAEVHLVCATRGEAGFARGREMRREELSELRSEELAASCRALGLREPRFLDWPDGGVAKMDPAERRAQLERVLQALSPDVVITLGEDGVYGHSDHVALTQTCIEIAPGRRLLGCVFPAGLFAPLASKMAQYAPELLVDDLDIEDLGGAHGVELLTIDIRSVAARKRAAIGSHRSQLLELEPVEFLLPGLIDAVCDNEQFSVLSGAPLDHAKTPFERLEA